MDTVYWISFIVGGFFVLLSIFGGADTDMDADAELDLDVDADADIGAGHGFVDLFSLRTVFLFAAFFGLCGVVLPLADIGELARAVISFLTGATVGIGGNYIIKRVGYDHVSSTMTSADMLGRSGRVLVPFDQTDTGKITIKSKGQRRQLLARAFEEAEETFGEGDEVVIVGIRGAIAEVVKPS